MKWCENLSINSRYQCNVLCDPFFKLLACVYICIALEGYISAAIILHHRVMEGFNFLLIYPSPPPPTWVFLLAVQKYVKVMLFIHKIYQVLYNCLSWATNLTFIFSTAKVKLLYKIYGVYKIRADCFVYVCFVYMFSFSMRSIAFYSIWYE